MMPDRPLSSAGDTILVADVGQSRFLRVTPDGRVAGLFAFPAAAAMSGQFHGADRQGRLDYLGSRYGEERGVGQRRAKSIDDALPACPTRHRSSAGIGRRTASTRWPACTSHRSASPVPAEARPSDHHVAPAALRSRGRLGGAAGRPRRDPRVADYHVDWIAPDGKRTASPAIAFRREPVTRADKDRILKPAQAMLSGGAKFTVAAPKESDFVWPDAKPPFVAHFTLVTPEGRIWVQRSVAEGAEPLYDELDERGRVARRYVLPKGARVVGFGKGAVYVTQADEDDLIHLQRFQRERSSEHRAQQLHHPHVVRIGAWRRRRRSRSCSCGVSRISGTSARARVASSQPNGSTPIWPSPISMCRSWFEPSAPSLSLRWKKRGGSPVALSNSSRIAVSASCDSRRS